jgi:hypothetical protein
MLQAKLAMQPTQADIIDDAGDENLVLAQTELLFSPTSSMALANARGILFMLLVFASDFKLEEVLCRYRLKFKT